MSKRLLNGMININHFGYDPYNSIKAKEIARTIVHNFPGPLTDVAYRSQQGWDFKALPSLLQTQAE